MYELIKDEEDLTSSTIVSISQKLDKALNEYYEFKISK